MKKFSNIIMSDEEPRDKTVLWLKDGVLYQFEGGWKSVLKSSPSTPSVSDINDLPFLIEGNSAETKAHNLAVYNEIKNSDTHNSDILGGFLRVIAEHDGITYNAICIFTERTQYSISNAILHISGSGEFMYESFLMNDGTLSVNY